MASTMVSRFWREVVGLVELLASVLDGSPMELIILRVIVVAPEFDVLSLPTKGISIGKAMAAGWEDLEFILELLVMGIDDNPSACLVDKSWGISRRGLDGEELGLLVGA